MFKAEHFKMLDAIEELLTEETIKAGKEMKSYALQFKCRNNSKFNYKEVLKKTEEIAKRLNHFSDIYYPQWTIIVEIINHMMCVSVVDGLKEKG